MKFLSALLLGALCLWGAPSSANMVLASHGMVPVPVAVNLSNPGPTILDNSGPNTFLSNGTVVMSSGQFTGQLSISDPSGIMVLNGTGGSFTVQTTSTRSLNSMDDGTHPAQVCAQENNVQKCSTITLTVNPTGGGGCNGIPNMFGLTCDPAMSDEFNAPNGTAIDGTKWAVHDPNGGATVSQTNGSAVMDGTQADGFDSIFQIPGAPSYFEIRFAYPTGVDPKHDSAMWFRTGLYIDNFPQNNPQCPGHPGVAFYLCGDSTSSPDAIELDFYEQQTCFSFGEAHYFGWVPDGTGGPPYASSEVDFGYNGAGCGNGNYYDGNFHVVGIHRWLNGNNYQSDFYQDGSLYASLTTNDPTWNRLSGTLPIRLVMFLTGQATELVDYIRVFH